MRPRIIHRRDILNRRGVRSGSIVLPNRGVLDEFLPKRSSANARRRGREERERTLIVRRRVLPDRVLGSLPQTSPPRVAMFPISAQAPISPSATKRPHAEETYRCEPAG